MTPKNSNKQQVKTEQRIKNPLPKRLYTIKEAAEYLGRGVWGVRDLIWKGILPVVKMEGGKKLYLDIRDIDLFIDKNKAIYR
jgi:excisionase family DNA binding protein